MKEHVDEIKSILNNNGHKVKDRDIYHYGSRTIENASTPESDYDYLVFLGSYSGLTTEAAVALTKAGFELQRPSNDIELNVYIGKGIQSWRKGEINLVLTNSMSVFEGHKKANELCRYLKVMDKQARWRVFDCVTYDRDPFDDTRKTLLVDSWD